ncbi:MAG: hypothetical protein D6824_09250 [Planctomycetota bacterium]|nr:MAG: hypothetical protein D6824_09250 [Planctomycetota bacterium]
MTAFRETLSTPSRRWLLGLNAVLAAAIVLVAANQLAAGQRQQDRKPGEYTMVAGRVQGMPQSALYIVDAANQEMVAVAWNRNRRQLEPVGFRDLAEDAKRVQEGGR